jgi:3-deoxy-manno-octulosonate cytidylyltransferase (CMP-KDO synthetase)
MRIVAVIPARYGSTRFPAKMLANRTGRPLVQHVVEQVRRARRIERVIVATDDERIARAVQSFGGESRMTRGDHQSGTDRVAEAAESLDADVLLNVQGDEPEMDPDNIDRLAALMQDEPACRIGTVACPFPPDRPERGPGSPADPNCVKVVVDPRGRALYFSRALVPYPRDAGGRPEPVGDWLLHLGLYGFRRATLLELARLKPSRLEQVERLEQLRWLENGYTIHVAIGSKPSAGIDTPEDYEAFVRRRESAS